MKINQAHLFIVGGAPRSGKSTLARELAAELKLSHIAIDSIVHAFEKTQPELGIRHLGTDDWNVCDRVAPFLVEQTRWHIQHGIPVIVEGYHLRPEALLTDWADFSFRVVFVGYPNSTPIELMKTVRENETARDWTVDVSDSDLLPLLDRFVYASRVFEKSCRQTGVPFIDVGPDMEDGFQSAKKILLGKKT